MKNINYNFFILLVLSVFLMSCGDDKKSSTEPENQGHDEALVGTWELTKILSPLATTPDEVGLALTAVFSSNGNLTFTTVDVDGTAIDNGTWSTSDGVLTLNIEGEDAASSPYSVSGNIANINAYPVDFQGTVVLASLEFTKQ